MIDHKKIAALAAVKEDNCISFFIPTHRVDGIQEDQIKYKNSIAELSKSLLAKDLNPAEVDDLLKEAKSKLQDEEFWQQLSDTLAVFIYNGKTEFYFLPYKLDAYTFIGDSLYLLPLLPMSKREDDFYLLALSQNEVKIYEGDQYNLAELEKNDAFPESLAQILATYDADSSLQHHSGGDNSTIFHGQGAGEDQENVRQEEFLRRVNEGVQEMACDDDSKPLIVYTTPSLIGLYRQINTYPNLTENYIEGNPENETAADLHAKAWEALLPMFVAREEANDEAFEGMLAQDQASFNLLTIGPAAFAGRIDRLYVATNTESWGTYNPSTHLIELHAERQPDSRPLLNDIALAVFQQGGTVNLRDRQDLARPTAHANATFRYALQTA